MFGVVAVTQAMLRLLGETPAARIVSVDPSSPQRALFGPIYSPSKTALDAPTLAFAIEFEDPWRQRCLPRLHFDEPQHLRGYPYGRNGPREPFASRSSTRTVRWARFPSQDGPFPW
ncbi:hypothetical protein [Mesorhizobium sp.]|uniref:hypothetical protein n=1 Tax=Mesorhizobium sp. TaxID=1871066 RepID=UPI00257B6D30|nr:hypothetical protein [Mesorhizobium sp.]